MNPLVKKEIRLLLPTFLIGVALTFSILFLPDIGSASGFRAILIGLPFLLCPATAVGLALGSFGAEVSYGTFSGLLAQPVPRARIWQVKIRLLAAALCIGGVLWSALFYLRFAPFADPLNPRDYREALVCAWMFLLVVFSGGLWTVLLLRQAAAALWFTLLVPGAILVLTISLTKNLSDATSEGVLVAVFLIYSLAGFWFARWLFFRAQDTQWSGGTIALPEMRGLARWKSFAGMRRMWRPRAALWRKEIQLHQSQIVIAFALLVLHLGVIVTRHWGHYTRNSTTELVLEGFWALWLVMPLLMGCAAVAEERKLGMLEGQLCLPVKRRTQFAVKLLVALGLSVVFGVIMPLLLEGRRVWPTDFWPLALPIFAGVSLLIGGISFYVSTLARNTLQTLAPAVAGIALAVFLMSVATIPRPFEASFGFLWRGPLPYFILFPALALTLLALAYRNFQHVLTGWKLGRRNALTLASVFLLGVVATSAIYHRAWEKLTPFEPPHGAARLTLANPASLSVEGGDCFVRLPDGRIWTGSLSSDSKLSRLGIMLGNAWWNLNEGQFISGSNWMTIQRVWRDMAGIKTDGTHWVSEGPIQITESGNQPKINRDEMRHLVQFGAETNWTSLAPGDATVLLTKADGTLWRWGTIDSKYFEKTNHWPGLREFKPERLGTESNWEEVFQSSYRTYLRKTDGSVWMVGGDAYERNLHEIGSRLKVGQILPNESHGQFRNITEIYNFLNYRVGIRDDGTFRILAHLKPVENPKLHASSFVWTNSDLQIGDGTNWLAAAGVENNKIVTLRNDGTLWLWNFEHNRILTWNPDQFEQVILKTVPVQLGTHSDWIAISGTTALAADGSLWAWPLWEPQATVRDEHDHPIPQLLDISRKPHLLGNVFGKAD